MTKERWKPLRLAPTYAVSSLGRLRNPQGRILRTSWVGNGRSITLSVCGTPHCLRVARLVGEAFNAGYAADRYPIYKNGDRTDCRPCNLQWVPRSQVAVAPFTWTPRP